MGSGEDGGRPRLLRLGAEPIALRSKEVQILGLIES